MIRLFCIAAALLACLPETVSAKEPARFQPAEFGAKKEAIVRKIHFPDSYPGTPVEVLCEAQIAMRGRMYLDFCYPTKHYAGVKDYVYAVWHAFHRVYVSPARVNGQRVVSHMQIRVRFEKNRGNGHISLFPNLGLNAALYGSDYIAAQYYWEKQGTGHCEKDANLVLSMQVERDGNLSDVKLLNKGVSDYCTGYFVRLYKRRKFIPAYYHGQPVRSCHLGYMNLDPNVNTVFINLGVLIGRIELESRRSKGKKSPDCYFETNHDL
jgi:hypothetical protein